MPPLIGTHIGRDRVLERLGGGGMGEVCLVEDTRLHRRGALKLVGPILTGDETRSAQVCGARSAGAVRGTDLGDVGSPLKPPISAPSSIMLQVSVVASPCPSGPGSVLVDVHRMASTSSMSTRRRGREFSSPTSVTTASMKLPTMRSRCGSRWSASSSSTTTRLIGASGAGRVARRSTASTSTRYRSSSSWRSISAPSGWRSPTSSMAAGRSPTAMR